MTQQTPSDYVLVVDDDAELVRIVLAALRRLEVQTKVASTGRQALQTVVDDTPAVMLLDMRLPDMLGMEVLQYIRDHGLVTTVIVMTAYGSVEIAVEAMRLGAYDFLTKPLDLKRLDVVMRNSLERQRLLAELDDYRRVSADTTFHGLIGSSPPMQRLFRQVRNAAPGSAPRSGKRPARVRQSERGPRRPRGERAPRKGVCCGRSRRHDRRRSGSVAVWFQSH